MLLKRQNLSADRANNSMLVPLSLPFFYDSESSSPKQISFKLTFVSFKSELIIFSPIMKQSPKITWFFFFFHFTFIRNIVLSKLIESQGTFKFAPYSQSSNLQGHFFSIFTLEINFLLKVILFNVFSLSHTTSPYYPSNL